MDPGIVYFQNNLLSSDESSESDLEMENAVLQLNLTASFFVSSVAKNKERSTVERKNYFVEKIIPSYTDKEFQEDFRMTRPAFNWLLSQVENKLRNFRVGRDTIMPKKQLLATIWILSTPDSYRSIARKFDMPKSTLHKGFKRVVEQLTKLAPKIIAWPSAEQRAEIKRDNVRWGNIPGVVGAIDGTYVPIKAPKENAQTYINRKCFHSITLQAICDNKRRFLDIFSGYPSSVGDARIFRNSDFFKTVLVNPQEYFGEGEIILGDKAYPVLSWCIPPYIDRGNLGPRELNFNTKHAKTRQTIERSFALLFGRFRRLKYLDMSRVDLIPNVILACCVLHNICLMFPDDLIQIYEFEGQVNGDEMEENENPVEGIEATRREGLRIRDQIANSLILNN